MVKIIRALARIQLDPFDVSTEVFSDPSFPAVLFEFRVLMQTVPVGSVTRHSSGVTCLTF